MRSVFVGIALTAGICLLPLEAAQASLAVTFTTASQGVTSTDESVGWSFTTTAALTVISLDDFAPVATGNEVRLYDSAGIVLRSAIVLPTDPVVFSNGIVSWNAHAITPLTLQANTTYYIVADLYKAGTGQAYDSRATLTTYPGIVYNHGVLAVGTGLNPMSNPYGLEPSYFGPNFEIAPEPASLVSAATGILMLTGYAWRRRKVQATA